MVLEGTCSLYGYEESWDSAKKHLLSDLHFLEKLIEFNVNSVPESRFVKLRNKYLSNNDFNKESVLKQS